jgi:hypothetical protein
MGIKVSQDGRIQAFREGEDEILDPVEEIFRIM